MTSPDHLSVCPSLIYTLSLVNHSDIPNCKLVSRKLYHVISRHPNRIGREEIEIAFCSIDPMGISSRGHQQRWLLVTGDQIEYEIHEDRVRMLQGNDMLKDNFERKGIQSIVNDTNPEKSELASTDYFFPSSLKGLRAVLSVLCRRYHFIKIRLADTSMYPCPLEWFEEIGSQFQHYGCVARRVVCLIVNANSGTFINKLGVSKDSTECYLTLSHVLSQPVNLISLDIFNRPNLTLGMGDVGLHQVFFVYTVG